MSCSHLQALKPVLTARATQAEAFCNVRGGHLLSIQSADENYRIAAQLQTLQIYQQLDPGNGSTVNVWIVSAGLQHRRGRAGHSGTQRRDRPSPGTDLMHTPLPARIPTACPYRLRCMGRHLLRRPAASRDVSAPFSARHLL
jgi:hypothetical protein